MPIPNVWPRARAALTLPAVHYPAVATWLALALLSWILAAWTWRLLGPGAHAVARQAPPPQLYRTLAQRAGSSDLFWRGGVVSGFAGAGEALAPAPVNIVLRGVYAPRSGRGGFAVLEVDGHAVSALVGQEVAPGLLLQETRDDHVLLARADERLKVSLATGATGTTVAGVSSAFQMRLQTLGEGRYALSRADLDEAGKNPEVFASMGRFVAHPRGGVVLEHSPDEGLAQQLGLRVGDIVTHINQRPLRGPEDAARLFSHIAGSERVTLSVLRQERPLTVTIELQP